MYWVQFLILQVLFSEIIDYFASRGGKNNNLVSDILNWLTKLVGN